MPPYNCIIPAIVPEGGNIVKINQNDEQLFSRKTKNHLNTSDLSETESKLDVNGNVMKNGKLTQSHEIKLVWLNIIAFVFMHYWAFFGLLQFGFNCITLFSIITGVLSGFGITAGAHRLWAHGAYKANLILRIILAYFQTMAFQNAIYEWTRDHRAHHKFTDTNADPHSASRGFFFAHMGWLLCKKHPDVKKCGEKIDMKDLERDPVVMFQKKYYVLLMPLCHTVIPVAFSVYFIGVDFYTAWCFNMFRYIVVLHFTWLVNSYAHFFGSKPFDVTIKPTDSYTVALLAFGEGWHNYHHVFPYDYKTSEHGKYWCNYTTGFIDFMSRLGWATDLKTINPEIIRKRAQRTGDGSYLKNRLHEENEVVKEVDERFDAHIWGWQDEMVTAEEKEDVTIINGTHQE